MKPLLNAAGQPVYLLRRIADKATINARANSNTIPPAPPNGGTDYEYLPVMIEDAPDFDPVFTVRTQVEATNETAHTREITFTVADRPKEEQLQAVDNAKRFEVSKHVPVGDFTESTILTLAAILRSAKGLDLNPSEKAAMDRLVELASILQRNADTAEAKKVAVKAGEKPDLSADWEPVPAEVALP